MLGGRGLAGERLRGASQNTKLWGMLGSDRVRKNASRTVAEGGVVHWVLCWNEPYSRYNSEQGELEAKLGYRKD